MINEQSLQLTITDKSLGSLTTNAQQIKAAVEAALPDYDIANYNSENIATAKEDKALLNKASKALNDKRIEIEKEFMKPFEEFKTIIGDTVKLISACSGKIDTVVKQSEEIEREEKRTLINGLWEKHGSTLVPLSKVFNEKWLLKGTKEKDIIFNIEEKVLSIDSDLTTIEAIGEDVETLKSMYLESLNLNSTIQYARRLKDNRERIAAEETRRAAYVPPPKPEPTPEPIPAPPVAEVVLEVIQPTPVPQNPYHEYFAVATFKITGLETDIDAVVEFLDELGIDYERTDA